MTKLSDIILRDTRANQPAAGTAGRIYYVTDENVTERDNGSTWQDISDAGGGSGAPTTAKYITTASDGTLSAEVVIPGLAGSPDIKGAGGAGTAEEFDSGASPLTWGSAPATEDVNTTILSHLYLKSTATGENLGTKAWSPAGAFDARCKVLLGNDSNANYCDIGLHIGESGNTSRLLIHQAVDVANLRANIQANTYATGSYTQRGSTWLNMPLNGPIYFRITRDGSNNCSFYWSTNGFLWQLVATQSFTLTVANIGFRIDQGAATAAYYAVDWLRTDV